MCKILLGVNVDHIATLRQSRGTEYPNPLDAAVICEASGANSIVMHLREDRRHIHDRDVLNIKKKISIPFNMEMSINKEIVDIALKIKPARVTLVPEKRKELTTEGGLDLVKYYKKIALVSARMESEKIEVSLFIDPLKKYIDLAKKMSVPAIEINTGRYADAVPARARDKELAKIKGAARYAKDNGLFVAAGHGLTMTSVSEIAMIDEISELNIGHSIISRAVLVGLPIAVAEMIEKINGDRI